MKRFVFLDRDGTLTRDEGYTHRVADFGLLPGVAEGLQRLRRAGFELAIVTNQSGIGRGLFEEADFEAFQEHLAEVLRRDGIELIATFHCPHAPEDGCDCRKPAPGLLLRARDELGAELSASWMIGDSVRDAEAARRAGCAGAVLIGAEEAAGAERAASFLEACDHVLAHAGDRPAS